MSDDKESDKACAKASVESVHELESRWTHLASADEYEIENIGRHEGRVFDFECRMAPGEGADETVLQNPTASLETVNEYLMKNYGRTSETNSADELSPWPSSFDSDSEGTLDERANELESWTRPVERVYEFESRMTPPVDRTYEFESGSSSDERPYRPMPLGRLQESRTVWSISDYLVRRYPRVYAWGSVIGSFTLSIGGLVAGGYVLRHVDRPAGWAVTAFSIGAAGFYLMGRSLIHLCCPPSNIENDNNDFSIGGPDNLSRENALNYEAEYYIRHPEALQAVRRHSETLQALRRHAQTLQALRRHPEALRRHQYDTQPTLPVQGSSNFSEDPEIDRLNSEIYRLNNEISRLELEFSNQNAGSSSAVSPSASSSLPVASVSTVSSDPLNINLAVNDYRPRTTELSSRPSDKSQGKRKRHVSKAWTSAPNVLQNPQEDIQMSMNLELDVEVAEEENAAEENAVQEVEEENTSRVLERKNTVEELDEENPLEDKEKVLVEVAEEAIAAEQAEDVIEVAEEAIEVSSSTDENTIFKETDL